MSNLLKILGLLVDLIAWVVRVKQQEKRNDEVQTIRKDPVDAFRSEFGGVPDNEAGQPNALHRSEAGVEVDTNK